MNNYKPILLTFNRFFVMKKSTILLAAFTLFLGLFFSCKKENNLPYQSDNLKLPAQALDYNLPTKSESGLAFEDNKTNPITDAGATLGRVLFYDKKLSLNNQIACASCHHQEKAFADPVQFSKGFDGLTTTRNASTIVNPSLEKEFFWDLREATLENLALQPVRNHIEMGIEDMDKLAVKLNKIGYYPELFEKAFGSKEINGEKISKAMAQFLRSIVTYRSKFDEGKRLNFSNFSADEKRGKELFMDKLHCGNCHGGDNFNTALQGELAFNIGLDIQYKDNGLGVRSGNNKENGVFKVPSLRNVALTAPYMHDGRFKTLEEVVDHYDMQLQPHENLFASLRVFTWEGNGGGQFSGGSIGWNSSGGVSTFQRPNSLALKPEDKRALIAFLKTLTDDKMIKEEKYSSPF
jgi:cytochrome c peroxidase